MRKTRLLELRIDNDKTQKEICAYLGIKQQQYNRYERDEYPIPIEHLIKLAKYYKVTTDYILKIL